MNCGRLSSWAQIYAYSGGSYEVNRNIYCEYKYASRAVYSPYAGAKEGATVRVRECALTKHNAFGIGGRFFLITNIDDTERGFLTLTLAAVEPIAFSAVRPSVSLKENNRAQIEEAELSEFTGFLGSKYVKFEQQDPQAVIETVMILTVPKEVELRTGDVVSGDDKRYAVTCCHPEDAYRNDYEIIRIEDA